MTPTSSYRMRSDSWLIFRLCRIRTKTLCVTRLFVNGATEGRHRFPFDGGGGGGGGRDQPLGRRGTAADRRIGHSEAAQGIDALGPRSHENRRQYVRPTGEKSKQPHCLYSHCSSTHRGRQKRRSQASGTGKGLIDISRLKSTK